MFFCSHETLNICTVGACCEYCRFANVCCVIHTTKNGQSEQMYPSRCICHYIHLHFKQGASKLGRINIYLFQILVSKDPGDPHQPSVDYYGHFAAYFTYNGIFI